MTDHTITLEQPITRGDTEISTVTLRRPLAGELRGIKLIDAMQMDADAMMQLLPRITQPALQAHELAQLDLIDFGALCTKVALFFVTKQQQQASLPE